MSVAAPLARWRAHAAMETTLLLRNGENLLVTVGIPAGLLVFFTAVDVLPAGEGPRLAFLTPGILALAVLASAFTSLSIATGFERRELVLKRLGTTPLRRRELVAAKIAAVLVVQALQAVVLGGTGLALGWRPAAAGVPVAVLAVLLATAAYAGAGLALAGRLSALGNLAVTNAVFVLLLLCSGIVFPLEVLPTPLAAAARALPVAPLAEVLRASLHPGTQAGIVPGLGVLAVWALAAPALAARLFRWE